MRSNQEAATPVVVAANPDQAPRINSSQLLCGQRTVEIEHGNERYTLRLTRDNKLILTK